MCEVIDNPCHQVAQKCHNGAVCMNVGNAAICLCASGFVGKLCEFAIDECMR